VCIDFQECDPCQGLIVIIPTLDRRELLIEVLQDIRKSTVIPRTTYVIDSSDIFVELTEEFKDINLKHIKSPVKSAAHQRNRAIELALSADSKFGFVAFLDDDIEIYPTYFKELLQRFAEHQDFVGISGLAENQIIKDRKRSILSDFIGLTGKSGSITKALVNISPASIHEFKEVDWLIGCAMWKRVVIEKLRFEDDFHGQSIFEDVIFSYRAKSLGRIGFDPEIKFKHLLSPTGRPSDRIHYRNWVTNRHRLFIYTKREFSKVAFWQLTTTLIIVFFVKSLSNFREREKSIGIILGIKDLIKGYK
jgi:GT2 family glycosyltransferase